MILALINLIWDVLGVGFNVFMEISRLALEYLRVLVWPAAVLVLALIYRRPLVSVLHRLRKASGWGVSVEAEAAALARDSQITTLIEGSEAAAPDPDTSEPAAQEATEPDHDAAPDDVLEEAQPAAIDGDEDPQHEREHQWSSELADPTFNRVLESWRLIRERPDRGSFMRLTRTPSGGGWTTLEEGFNGESRAIHRRMRIQSAWATLTVLIEDIGHRLRLPHDELSLSYVVRILAERGYVNVGSWRIATRLAGLYHTIISEDDDPSTEVTDDFVVAAQGLIVTLENAKERVRRNTPVVPKKKFPRIEPEQETPPGGGESEQ